MTQAQYDALPASKLTDNILYCIKDVGIDEGDKFAPIIYSLDEREVGTWIDGKPLYQKTIVHDTALPYRQWTQISIGSGKKIVYYEGKTYLDGNSYPFSDLNYHRGADNNEYCCCCGYNNYTFQIYQSIGSSYTVTCIITVWYTKDDEVPGCGNWTTSGVPAVHYSTDEQVIGTWTNGKPLYQKTVEFNSSISGTSASLSLGIANVDKIFLCAESSSVNNVVPLPYVTGSIYNNNIGGFFNVSTNDTTYEIRIGNAMAGYIDSAIITVRYTKTTD